MFLPSPISFLWALFQILCRKSPGGTSGNFWWTQRGKWSASGGQTNPLTAFEKRWRRWCGKSSWRNEWSYDEALWWQNAQGIAMLGPDGSRARTLTRGLWTVSASAFWAACCCGWEDPLWLEASPVPLLWWLCWGEGLSETILWLIVPIMLNIVGKGHCWSSKTFYYWSLFVSHMMMCLD